MTTVYEYMQNWIYLQNIVIYLVLNITDMYFSYFWAGSHADMI